MTASIRDITTYLDSLLSTSSIPDYPLALNGLQCEHRGPVHRIASAVDFSLRTVEETARRGANLLLVHHGMFWGGLEPLRGATLERLRLLLTHDIAVYASHLPLDAHDQLGNSLLLAHALGLVPSRPFAHFQGVPIGVAGKSELLTEELIGRAERFAQEWGGRARASAGGSGRHTRLWGICTGAGATPETLREARALGLDTLIVGEGSHHTAVAAPELGLVIIYAGHYATETLGVRALGERLSAQFDLPSEFILAPTGL